MKITNIRQVYHHGAYADIYSMYFDWIHANSILLYENSEISMYSGDITIRTSVDSYEGCISVYPQSFLTVRNIDALDTLGGKACLLSNFAGYLQIIGNNTTIDGFLLGIGVGTYGTGPNVGKPGSSAFIENASGSSFTIQNCTTGIKIYNQSHATYLTAKPSYSGNSTNEDIQAGSTYQQGL